MDLWGLAGQLDSPRLAVQRPFERIPASDAASEGFSATISTLFMAPTILESYNGMANIIDDFSAAIDGLPTGSVLSHGLARWGAAPRRFRFGLVESVSQCTIFALRPQCFRYLSR